MYCIRKSHMSVFPTQAQTDDTLTMKKLIVMKECYQDWMAANRVVSRIGSQIDKTSKRLTGSLIRVWEITSKCTLTLSFTRSYGYRL